MNPENQNPSEDPEEVIRQHKADQEAEIRRFNEERGRRGQFDEMEDEVQRLRQEKGDAPLDDPEE